ncbi:MAG: hypothetical protein FWB91_14250, partial [Defluviitaleaceae bacterium]|nr:hypothetical protein [Defluviitaleaceae bacterium]
MYVLVINAGSSSLKYQLLDMSNENLLAKGICERIGIDGRLVHELPGKPKHEADKPMPNHGAAIAIVLDTLTDASLGAIKSKDEIKAIGHRVVHGGEDFSDSVLITDEVMEALKVNSDLAPLHNPANITGIRACMENMPGVPQVGVFDTAFHQTMPAKAYLYPIPYEMYEKHKIRKYGFHGTSHKFVSARATEMLQKPAKD